MKLTQAIIDGHFDALERAAKNRDELPHCNERVRRIAEASWLPPFALSLPSYAWPGGYPLYYIAQGFAMWDPNPDTTDLCPTCANRIAQGFAGEPEGLIVGVEVHWEGPPKYCDACGNLIPSAYGDDDDEQEEPS